MSDKKQTNNKIKKRVGPRPLGLYLAMLQYFAMPEMMRAWGNVFQQAQGDAGKMFDTETFKEHFSEVKADDITKFLAGVKRYHEYPWQREVNDGKPSYECKLVEQIGRVKLWDMGGEGTDRTPIMLVPSFINKAYIFDLTSESSLVEFLKSSGYQVFMVDWGEPEDSSGEMANELTVNNSIVECLVPFLETVSQLSSSKDKGKKNNDFEKVHLLGYCLGGLLATAMASLREDLVKSLTLVATPWDFSKSMTHKQLINFSSGFDLLLNSVKIIPLDVVQTQFVMLDPLATIRRLQAYAELEDEAQLHRLTAIEDWLADGVPLESGIARTILMDWYRDNQPMLGKWKIELKGKGDAEGGVKNVVNISPEGINVPCLVVSPTNDVIVSEESSLAFAEVRLKSQKECEMLKVKTGHIGLMAGRKSQETFYKPLVEWLKLKKHI